MWLEGLPDAEPMSLSAESLKSQLLSASNSPSSFSSAAVAILSFTMVGGEGGPDRVMAPEPASIPAWVALVPC